MGLGSNVRKRSERGARSKVDLEMVDRETKTKWKGVYNFIFNANNSWKIKRLSASNTSE